MKVILEYDPATGQISDKNGMFIGNWLSLQYEEVIDNSSNSTIDSAIIEKLAECPNINIHDIIDLKKNGII